MKALKHTEVKNITEMGRHSVGGIEGLHLWIKSNTSKYWILRYTLSGRRSDISLGPYPELTLKEAREKAVDAKKLVSQGKDPIAIKKSLKTSLQLQPQKISFKDFALQCIDDKKSEWKNKKHAEQWVYTLKEFAFPKIGNKAINEITTTDILGILRPIWQNKTHTAMRLRGRIEWILSSATVHGYREGPNPALWRGHLITTLPSPDKIAKTVHHAALPYEDMGDFIKRIRHLDCLSSLALEFTILTASRTEEVLAAKRDEIQAGMWIVPAERIKTKKEHRVPLTPRAIEILNIAKQSDPNSEYLFSRNNKRLSNMAMLSLVKGMGYKITVHGFRATFRTWSEEETAHDPAIAKRALAHTLGDKVDEAYNRGDLFKKRLMLMEDWAKFCNSESQTNGFNIKVA